MDRYEGSLTDLTITLNGGLYFAIKMDVMKGPLLPLL
jgi:hypothetical protein